MEEQNSKPAEDQKQTSYAGLGISIGAGFGLILGMLLFDNLAMGIGLGVAIGLLIGGGIDARNKKGARK